MRKRDFLKASAAMALSSAAPMRLALAAAAPPALPNLATDLAPISPAERRARIAKAQGLMRSAGIDALLLDAGSSLVYFTGLSWWRSERYTGAVIPAEGAVGIVTPYFEEPSVRETLAVEADVRTWHEDENPFAVVAGLLEDRGLKGGKIAVEETVRFFITDGVARAAPAFTLAPGAAIVRGCRLYKSPVELALMQAANGITLDAYRHVYGELAAGMTPGDIAGSMNSAIASLGGKPEFALVLLNDASAYPHGTEAPQVLREGSVVLMDCGASVHGYQSDVSRTWVFGEPTKKQREVWNTVKRGQELALETAQPGTAAGKVDDVVRAYYASLGYGPGYATPGLPHRLGHGIGLDVHEPVNFVHGETTPLAPGMCLSNEPGLYLYGEFGVRLEDCLYMTADGPALFTPLARSLDDPI